MVGIGPGSRLDRTRRAEQAIADAHVIVGYVRYVELIADLCTGKQVLASGMRQEVERCRQALRAAADGARVALVSSGDPGVYGMAGLALELAGEVAPRVPITVVPGVTAANAVAARLGAPLMLDFAVLSLSDLLVPWQQIRHRLEAVAAADLVTVLYNPRSKRRVAQLCEAQAVFAQHRPGSTPVGIGTAVGSDDERIVCTSLEHLLEHDVGMRSTVIVGNSASTVRDTWLLTARGYRL